VRQLEPAGLPCSDVDGGQHDGRLGAADLTATLPPAQRRHRERLCRIKVSPLELQACGGTVQIAVGVGGGGLPQLPRLRQRGIRGLCGVSLMAAMNVTTSNVRLRAAVLRSALVAMEHRASVEDVLARAATIYGRTCLDR
jgi:hypothetical protein